MVCAGCALGQGKLEDVMRMPCTALVNWEEIVEEICRSNIIQRDNVKFARKLNKDLVPIAKEKNKTAKNEEELWCERSRRRVLHSIMAEWVRLSSSAKAGSVKSLVAALSLPGWFDVKLRVLKLLEENCAGD